MFRVKTDKSINFLRKPNQDNGFNKLFKAGVILVLAVIGYGIWTHGTFKLDGGLAKKLEAQAQSPLPPEWQKLYFGKDVCTRENYCGPEADPDKDGFSNYEEFLFFTDPTDPDTDKDGATDGEEVRTNFTNPVGDGPTPRARDINELSEYNPFADELVSAGLEEIRTGNILNFDQIQQAAASLTQLPEFTDIPFKLTSNNSQEAVTTYAGYISQATDNYRNSEAVEVGAHIIDTTDEALLDKYIESTQVYAISLVHVDTPFDLAEFHKAMFGSIVFRGLIAEAQKEFLQNQISEDQLREKVQDYTIYYTRFVQEMHRASDEIKEKYEFPFTFDEEAES